MLAPDAASNGADETSAGESVENRNGDRRREADAVAVPAGTYGGVLGAEGPRARGGDNSCAGTVEGSKPQR